MDEVSLTDQCRAVLSPRIRFLRVARVADKAGLHRQHVSAWLRGKRDLPMYGVDALAKASGVRLTVAGERVDGGVRPTE